MYDFDGKKCTTEVVADLKLDVALVGSELLTLQNYL